MRAGMEETGLRWTDALMILATVAVLFVAFIAQVQYRSDELLDEWLGADVAVLDVIGHIIPADAHE